MASSPTAHEIRTIIREELRPLRDDVAALDRKFTKRFDRLEKMLAGVIDKDFPPVDQQARSGGPPGTIGVAAKGR